MTPVSNPRPAALRRRVLRAAGVPPSPSPLARQVPIHAAMEEDESKDDDVDADAEESMAVDKLEVSDLQDAEDSMVLDSAPEEDEDDDEDEDEELEDVDLDELEPITEMASTGIGGGKGVFMRVSDAFGNFVGDIFATGRARRSREPYTAGQEAQTLDAILPELSSHARERADEAVNIGVGPSTSEASTSTDSPSHHSRAVSPMTVVGPSTTEASSNTDSTSYCSRAVSPIESGPDPREAEIEELRAQVAQLTSELDFLRSASTQKDARIGELERQLAGKQRRLQILMNLHAQMDEEVCTFLLMVVAAADLMRQFAMERAGH